MFTDVVKYYNSDAERMLVEKLASLKQTSQNHSLPDNGN